MEELESEKDDLVGNSSEKDEKKLDESKIVEVREIVMPDMLDCLIALGKLAKAVNQESEETIFNIGEYFKECQILN